MGTEILNDNDDSTLFIGLPPLLPEDMVVGMQQQIDAMTDPVKKGMAQIMLDNRRRVGEIVAVMVGPQPDAGKIEDQWAITIGNLDLPDDQKSSCFEMLDARAWDFLYSVFNDAGVVNPPPPTPE